MIQPKLQKTVNSKIHQRNQTGYYCLKNGEYPQNRTNSRFLELKICKVKLSSLLRCLWIQKKMRFYDIRGVGNFMELFGNKGRIRKLW